MLTCFTTLYRACRYSKLSAVQLLLGQKVDFDAQNVNGHTPLHLACLSRDDTIVDLLLKAGADYSSKNIEGDRPTHVAVKVST
jgi:ankyrin repeat protein